MRVVCICEVKGPRRGQTNAPGAVLELDEDVARALIRNGSVKLAAEGAPRPAAPNPNGPAAPRAGDADTSPEDDEILSAILELDEDDKSLWLGDGRPKVEALEAALGRKVTAVDRDRLWAEAQK